MADLTDVQTGLVALISQILYPNGTANPSVSGTSYKIYPGWPQPQTLDADMASGIVHVSVFAPPMSRTIPQMGNNRWQQSTVGAQTITGSVAGDVLTLSGTISTPMAALVTANGTLYSYAVQATDTLTSICTALASQIPNATSSNATLTVPNAWQLSVAFSVGSTAIKEVGRQQQLFQVSVWAPTPGARQTAAIAIDPLLRDQIRIALPDNTWCQIRARSMADTDANQKPALFIRHLHYECEYATIVSQATQTVAGQQITTTLTGGTL